MSDTTAAAEGAAALMPEVIERLETLVRIPSVAFPGFDPEPVHATSPRRAVVSPGRPGACGPMSAIT